MLSLSRVAETMARDSRQGATQKLGLMLRVRQALGPRISPYVGEVRLRKATLYIEVTDNTWLGELKRERNMILGYLKSAIPQISKVIFSERK